MDSTAYGLAIQIVSQGKQILAASWTYRWTG